MWASGLRERSLTRTQENNLPDPSFLLLIHNPEWRKEIKYLNAVRDSMLLNFSESTSCQSSPLLVLPSAHLMQ